MRKQLNNKAFSLTELMIAVAFSVLLMTGVYSFYNAASQAYSSGVSGEILQDGANIVLSKIIEGETESGVVYRLATAVSFMVPDGSVNFMYSCGGAPKATPCNTNNLSGELYFCQDNPAICNYNDATARWYYLNSTNTSVLYHHPKPGGGTIEENVYTAPAGSILTLRFGPASILPAGTPPACPQGTTPVPLPPAIPIECVLPNLIDIDVGLRQNLSQQSQLINTRLSATSSSGAASTYVLLRNHQ